VLEYLASFLSQSLLLTWCAFIVIGSVAELLFSAEPKQPPAARLVNSCYGALYAAVIFATGPVIFLGVNVLAGHLGTGWIDLSAALGSSIPAQLGAAVLLYFIIDFFYYWLHRAQHAIPWLWDQHAVHHSETALNVTTSVRHHWTEFMIQAFAISLPMAVIFKLPPVTLWAVSMGFAAWSFFIHTNVRIQLGRWSWLACGPQVHRIHHSRLPQHADKNFAAYFPVWDLLFGTYCAPKKDEFPPTGLQSGERIDGALLMAVWPFKVWIAKAAAHLR
jgi:sterol desaturase/sphingolipid hydroxylase (fatty acid hydroxylase superfamily)